MKRARSYDEYDDHFYPRKRYIPIRNPTTNRVIHDYEDLIESSTGYFRSKHMILDFERRMDLLWICDDLLGSYYEKCIHAASCTELVQAVDDACEGLALKRLNSIMKYGFFTAGDCPTDTNTLIVSARERMLVHIEKSNYPGYDLFIRIEQKKSCDSMSYHFSCDATGKFDHFRP